MAPDGTLVLFTLGAGVPNGAQQNCSGSTARGAPTDGLWGRAAGCAEEQGTDYEGHDIQPVRSIPAADPAACCAACRNATGCAAWTLQPAAGCKSTANCCYLKTSAAGRRRFKGAVSGTMGSGPPSPPPAPPQPPPPAPPASSATANFTVHSAPAPLGPWTATTVQIEGWNSSWNLLNWNPAPVMLGSGQVRVMAHTNYVGWSGEVILEAPSWRGPYKVVGSDLIDHCEFCEEDPYMWVDHR